MSDHLEEIIQQAIWLNRMAWNAFDFGHRRLKPNSMASDVAAAIRGSGYRIVKIRTASFAEAVAGYGGLVIEDEL